MPANKLYIGIDPGGTGGMALVGTYTATTPMPATERDVWEWFRLLPSGRVFAVIEQVGGYVAGSGGNVGSAMFKFGANYGGLRMALTAAGIPFEVINPTVWLRGLGIPTRRPHDKTERYRLTKGKRKGQWAVKKTGGETDPEWKNRLKAKAQQLFPGVEVTLGVADALLIAEFCRRKREGKL